MIVITARSMCPEGPQFREVSVALHVVHFYGISSVSPPRRDVAASSAAALVDDDSSARLPRRRGDLTIHGARRGIDHPLTRHDGDSRGSGIAPRPLITSREAPRIFASRLGNEKLPRAKAQPSQPSRQRRGCQEPLSQTFWIGRPRLHGSSCSGCRRHRPQRKAGAPIDLRVCGAAIRRYAHWLLVLDAFDGCRRALRRWPERVRTVGRTRFEN